jgi:hypothetical protein
MDPYYTRVGIGAGATSRYCGSGSEKLLETCNFVGQ